MSFSRSDGWESRHSLSASSLPLSCRLSALLPPKRVNDKQHYCNRDARIGDVKGRPGISVADVQIKKEKVDHVSVEQTIRQISQNACEEKRQRYIPPRINPPVSHQQNCDDDQSDEGNYNEESVVALERSKGGAVIGYVNQVEKVRHYNARIVRVDGSQYQLLRQLVQSIERKGDEEDEFHRLRRVEPLKR